MVSSVADPVVFHPRQQARRSTTRRPASAFRLFFTALLRSLSAFVA